MDCRVKPGNDSLLAGILSRSRRMLFSRAIHLFPALSELRAQGMPGARCARGLVCNGSGRAHTSIQVTPESPGIPHAMVLTATPCSPRCSGSLATVTPEKLAAQELDTSVEVSGPHDFARPPPRRSLSAHQRPPHPAPRP